MRPLIADIFPGVIEYFNNQIRSVAKSCPTLCDPMNHSTPGLHVHHQLLEFTQTHVHRVGDAIQPSHPLSSPFPPAPNPSQHQSLFQWVNSSHEVAKVISTIQLFYSLLNSRVKVSQIRSVSIVMYLVLILIQGFYFPTKMHGQIDRC